MDFPESYEVIGETRIDRPNQTAIRFLLFRIPTIRNGQLGMLAVLRIVNIINH